MNAPTFNSQHNFVENQGAAFFYDEAGDFVSGPMYDKPKSVALFDVVDLDNLTLVDEFSEPLSEETLMLIQNLLFFDDKRVDPVLEAAVAELDDD